MRYNLPFGLQLLAFFVILSVLAGCEDKVVFANNPPSDLLISRSRCYIWTGGELNLTGEAIDNDNDPLSYRWVCDAGAFVPSDGKGQSVKWIAPDEPGYSFITMTVTDGIEERSLSISVDVGEKFPTLISGTKEIIDRGYTYIIIIEDSPQQTITISPSARVTIGPGVKIIVDSEFGGLTVKGVLNVEGTEDRKVTIGPNSCGFGTETWGGIYYTGGSAGGTLKHLNLYEGTGGIQANEGAGIVLDTCSISDNTQFGVSVMEGSNAVITGCKIWDNGLGLFVTQSDITVRSSSIRYNVDGGVYLGVVPESVTDYSVLIEGCVIGSNDGDGITITGKASPEIHQCTIFFNGPASGGGYEIRLQNYTATDIIHAENNYWGYITEPEIEALIYDKADDPGLGAYVDFVPWLDSEP